MITVGAVYQRRGLKNLFVKVKEITSTHVVVQDCLRSGRVFFGKEIRIERADFERKWVKT